MVFDEIPYLKGEIWLHNTMMLRHNMFVSRRQWICMVSKSSLHSLQSLINGAEGVGLITVNGELSVTGMTPVASALCDIPPESPVLPGPLRDALLRALSLGLNRLIWSTCIHGQPRTLETHLSPLKTPAGTAQGHILLVLEASGQAREAEYLKRNNTILNALVHFDWQLHHATDWHKALGASIHLIGSTTEFDRIRVFRKLLSGDQTARLTCLEKWQASNLPQQSPAVSDEFPQTRRWSQLLQRGEPVFTSHAELSQNERKILKSHGIEAMALVPVFAGKDSWGIISFERCHAGAHVAPEEISALLAVGRSLGMAIQHQLAGERLAQTKIAFETTAEAIMICDEKKRITAVNKAFTTITGYSEDEALGRTPEILRSGKNSAELYITMWQEIAQNGCWRGEIWNRRKSGELYPEWLTITSAKNLHGQVTHYVAVFADISEAKESEERLHRLVNHDPLTGLPNRRLLNELLDRAIRRSDRKNQHIALLFVDLDRFKAVNDTLGHHPGDMLLSGVTRRLTAAVRECDTVARLGGDEFIIMMDSLKQPEDAAIVAKKVIAAMQESFLINGHELFIGASIGISIYPRDGMTAHDLIRAADIAMYQVKHEGRNDYRFYTSQLTENAHERLTLDTMLRHSLERNELVVHYQPQIALDTGKIIGAEALVRWQHPELGMVSPGKFIPLAEETGLIIQIGEWVLRQAANDLLHLEEAGYSLQSVSVNVSAMQIHRSHFSDTVYGVLVETGCDPEKLELEITESAIMNNVDYVIDVCRKLKNIGVKLALDDFGTGYSSLSYLKRFPLDKLKIDQSFVKELPEDAEDAAISGAIIGLGHNLGLTVIAEGVEKIEQEAFLRAKGCHEAQGYLYGKPVPYDAMLELLAMQDAEKS